MTFKVLFRYDEMRNYPLISSYEGNLVNVFCFSWRILIITNKCSLKIQLLSMKMIVLFESNEERDTYEAYLTYYMKSWTEYL